MYAAAGKKTLAGYASRDAAGREDSVGEPLRTIVQDEYILDYEGIGRFYKKLAKAHDTLDLFLQGIECPVGDALLYRRQLNGGQQRCDQKHDGSENPCGYVGGLLYGGISFKIVIPILQAIYKNRNNSLNLHPPEGSNCVFRHM